MEAVGRPQVHVQPHRFRRGYAALVHVLGIGLEGRKLDQGAGVIVAALLVSDPADPSAAVRYVVLLSWRDGQITTIRDFLYAPYVTESLAMVRG